MDDARAPKLAIDWAHLPVGAEADTLGPALHRAELRALTSDRLARTVTLTFDVAHLRRWLGLPEDTRFVLTLESVQSVRALEFRHWPGPRPDTAAPSPEEESQRFAAYVAQGRSESCAWSEVEPAIAAQGLEVFDAVLARGEDEVALKLQGRLIADDRWLNLFLHAGRLEVTRSDGVAFGLAQLEALGEAYWEALAERGEVEPAE